MDLNLYSAEGLSGVIFLAMVAATVGGALVAVNAKRLVRGVAGLALSFIGLAGLYYFLNSPFVALNRSSEPKKSRISPEDILLSVYRLA